MLVHGYFSIDLDEVRGIIQRQLPALRTQIGAILRDLGQPRVSERVRPYALKL